MPDSASGIEQFAVSTKRCARLRRRRAHGRQEADRDGATGRASVTTVTADASAYEDLALSPDGREIAMDSSRARAGTSGSTTSTAATLTRLTFDNEQPTTRSGRPTADGSCTRSTAKRSIYGHLLAGCGRERSGRRSLMSGKNWRFGTSWSPDGPFPVVRRAGSEDRYGSLDSPRRRGPQALSFREYVLPRMVTASSRPTAAGSPTSRTSPAGARSTSAHSRVPAASGRSRHKGAPGPNGPETERSCSSSKPTG